MSCCAVATSRVRIDFAWPAHRTAIEGDGRRWHAALVPLADEFVGRFHAFLPVATYPVPPVRPDEEHRYGEAVVREILGASFLEETVFTPTEVR